MKLLLNRSEVIDSGTLVAQASDNIRLFPFTDDEEYELEIAISFDQNSKEGVDLIQNKGNKYSLIRFSKKNFSNGDTIANRAPILFAVSDDSYWDYYANISLNFTGSRESYTVTIWYSIIKERA